MDDKEQAAIDALRSAGLEAEACAVESLRARHQSTTDALNPALRASYKSGQASMRPALADLLAGWRYIRQSHGDLYGVGWDRAQGKAEAALGLQPGQEMPVEWFEGVR